MNKIIYKKDFFKQRLESTRNSAEEIVPIIMRLTSPKSIVDVGCGSGIWLKVFEKHGIYDYLGIDGDYIREQDLDVSEDKIITVDLEKPQNINLKRKFDAVICLEVAEHLHQEYAEVFIDFLTQLGNIVIFSAAIPYQSGTNHFNEQWPDYWIDKFCKRGYIAIDCIRAKIWNNIKVSPHYAQNTFIFINKNIVSQYPLLNSNTNRDNFNLLPIVHPRIFLYLIKPLDFKDFSLKKYLLNFPIVLNGFIKRKFRFLNKKK